MPDPDCEKDRWFATEALPHDAALRGYLRGRFPGVRPAEIDDLVQECYVRLWRASQTGPIACAKAFLFVTARNSALNHLRHLNYERGDALTEMDGSGVLDERMSVPESAARSEELAVLIEAIKSLPDRCRQIVTMRKIFGLSQREVAARLGISENTVEAQGGIGLRKCIEYFRRKGHLPLR